MAFIYWRGGIQRICSSCICILHAVGTQMAMGLLRQCHALAQSHKADVERRCKCRIHGCRWFHDTLDDADLAINSMMWQVCSFPGGCCRVWEQVWCFEAMRDWSLLTLHGLVTSVATCHANAMSWQAECINWRAAPISISVPGNSMCTCHSNNLTWKCGQNAGKAGLDGWNFTVSPISGTQAGPHIAIAFTIWMCP